MIPLFLMSAAWVVTMFTAWQGYQNYKSMVKSEREKYDQLLQRTILMQQDIDSKTEQVEYLKTVFSAVASRSATAVMSDQQIAVLSSAVAAMVKAEIMSPEKLN